MAHLGVMKTTPNDPARARRRLISFVCAGVAFLVLAAIGVYGLVTGPNDADPLFEDFYALVTKRKAGKI